MWYVYWPHVEKVPSDHEERLRVTEDTWIKRSVRGSWELTEDEKHAVPYDSFLCGPVALVSDPEESGHDFSASHRTIILSHIEYPPARAWTVALLGFRADLFAHEEKRGVGRDARQPIDLSTVGSYDIAREFFIRSEVPNQWNYGETVTQWTISVEGLDTEAAIDWMHHDFPTTAMRTVMECSGNCLAFRFGLLSQGDWIGVALPTLLDSLRTAPREHTHIEVIGYDDETRESCPPRGFYSSAPGASWIFHLKDVQCAILASELNGKPLTLDHGYPCRLVVPGWYGCAQIKWVQRLRLCSGHEPPSAQMMEFASRTHQPKKVANVVNDYLPAIIPLSVCICRVTSRETELEIEGVMWGRTCDEFSLKVTKCGIATRVLNVSVEARESGWHIWRATWRPHAGSGTYDLCPRHPGAWKLDTGAFDQPLYVEATDIKHADGEKKSGTQ